MERKRVSIYHTCTPQQVKQLANILKTLLGHNLPQAEIHISDEGFIRYKSPYLMELPIHANTPRTASEAKEAAEFWLEKPE